MKTAEEQIEIIKNRILAEYRKHKKLDWAGIAAHKIYSEINEPIKLIEQKRGYLNKGDIILTNTTMAKIKFLEYDSVITDKGEINKKDIIGIFKEYNKPEKKTIPKFANGGLIK